jgi:dipeptidyl aminopeptidase/acylaminoacyl peptidase
MNLDLNGAPIPMADGVALNARTGRAVAATSEAGVLAFRRPLVTELVWVDRAGNAMGAATPPGTYLDFSIAPDGQHVAVAQLDPRTGNSDIWVFGPGRVARVTDDAAWDGDPLWSEDGQHVVYSSRRDGRWRIYRRPATAVGPEELLLDADTPVTPLQVLRSGQLVYYSRQSTADMWKLSSEGPAALAHTEGGFHTTDARLSSDERWLAHGSQRTLNISGFPFGASRRPIAEGASMPRWRRDGRELFYLSQEFTIVSVPVEPPRTPGELPGRTLLRASELTPTGINGQVYDAAPDGQRFLLKREVRSSPIHVVLNWEARLTPR